jgi:AhpD family alkylhydroperoxidase
MKLVQIYDPAMCCSTGVCGPEVDPALVNFASDLKWLEDQGVEVRRFGLANNPAAFVENEKVREALTKNGETALPLVLVDGTIVMSGRYPNRDELTTQLGLTPATLNLFTPAVAELVAIGASIAANCEPCLRFHVNEAEKLGVTKEDVSRAIAMATKVKEAPHKNVMRLAARLTGEPVAPLPPLATSVSDGVASAAVAKSPCCS